MHLILRYRWLVIAASLLITLIVSSGMKSLAFNPDSRVFFSEANPQLIALEALEDTFTRNENIYFAIKPHQGSVFTQETLSIIKALTDASWTIPYSSRVDSITNFQHMEVDGDNLIVDDLVLSPGQLSSTKIQSIRDIVLNEHALVNHLINPAATMAGININILKPGDSLTEVPEVVHFAEQLISSFESRYPQHEFFMTGSVAFDQAFSQVSQDDTATLVPLMYLIIIVGVGLLLRSFSASLVTFVIIGMSTIIAMGFMGHMGLMITSPTAAAPVIIMTLAVADSVHILSTIFSEMRRGINKQQAILESLRINSKPVFITSLTTAIGFLSMNASDVPPFRELGNIVAVGVFAAFVFSIFLLPAMVSVLPIRIRQNNSTAATISDRFARFVIHNRGTLLIGMSVMMAIITLGVLKIELNDNFIEYMAESYPIRSHTELIAREKVTGLDIIEYSINSGSSNGITNPVYLKNLDALGNWFEQQPDVLTVATFADTIKRLNQNMNGNDESLHSIPESSQLTAQYLLLYEMSLPYGLDLNNRMDIDKSTTRLTVILERTSAKRLRELDIQAREWMKTNLPSEMFSYGTGLSLVFAYISKRNIDTMLKGITIALVLISFILIIALGSVKYGLLSLIPNLFPAILAFGLWGYIEGQVGLAVAVVAAISLGIVVDDTVHFLSKYLRAKREKSLDTERAVIYSFNTVGSAIVITSIALVAGFSVLMFSGFYVNVSMGILTVMAIIFALLTDFLFLPPLLMAADKKTEPLIKPAINK